MAILQVRDIDDQLYASLKEIAKSENRSLSQEVVPILEKYLANPQYSKIIPQVNSLPYQARGTTNGEQTKLFMT
jgi:hypothetical protein